MGKLEDIQTLIFELGPDERARLREWFDEYDGDSWDRRFEQDVKDRKVHPRGEQARNDLREGRVRDV